jgi:hypothetical protein
LFTLSLAGPAAVVVLIVVVAPVVWSASFVFVAALFSPTAFSVLTTAFDARRVSGH